MCDLCSFQATPTDVDDGVVPSTPKLTLPQSRNDGFAEVNLAFDEGGDSQGDAGVTGEAEAASAEATVSSSAAAAATFLFGSSVASTADGGFGALVTQGLDRTAVDIEQFATGPAATASSAGPISSVNQWK